MLKDLIDQLCDDVKIAKVEDNKEKIYEVWINEDVKITFFDKEEKKIYFWSSLFTLPKENREDLFIYLMKANFLGQGTGGATIGATADDKFLTLSYIMPYEINYQEFRDKVEDFVNYLVYLREEIETLIEKQRQNIY